MSWKMFLKLPISVKGPLPPACWSTSVSSGCCAEGQHIFLSCTLHTNSCTSTINLCLLNVSSVLCAWLSFSVTSSHDLMGTHSKPGSHADMDRTDSKNRTRNASKLVEMVSMSWLSLHCLT